MADFLSSGLRPPSSVLVPATAFGQFTGQLIYVPADSVRCPYCGEFQTDSGRAIVDCAGCGSPFNPALVLADFADPLPPGGGVDPDQRELNFHHG